MPTQLSPGVVTNEVDLTTIVPSVATSTAAIAGIFNWGPVLEPVLISSETQLVQQFGEPNSNNAETWFTAANFLAYSDSIYVTRAANTSNSQANVGARNAFANLTTVTTNPVVINYENFIAKTGTFDTNALYIAKWPGGLYGNSLRVSQCDSPNAYSSYLKMVANADVTAVLSVNVGSYSVTVNVSSQSSNATAANNYANTLANSINTNDYILLGNSSIGLQYAQVTNVSSVATAGFTISLAQPYKLSTNFIANSTSSNTIQRVWEFYNVVGIAPYQNEYQANFGNSAVVDGIHVVVVDQNGVFTGTPGAVLEVYKNLSRATDALTISGTSNYYRTVINQNSSYVWNVNDVPGAVSNTSIALTNSTNVEPTSLPFANGSDGYNESNVPLGIVTSAYDIYNAVETYPISLVLQGKPIGSTSFSGLFTVNNFGLANYLIDNLISNRKDAVLFITPDDGVITSNKGLEAQALVAWENVLHSTSYAVMDTGYKYQYDRYNNVYRYLPMNGDIAGLCARTDFTNAAWWSPAGFNRGQIKNLVKLRYNPSTMAERDLLYSNSINPVVTFLGQGTYLYGDKTLLSQPSAFDRINVRRLFIVLEKAISQASKFTLFQFNDSFTRAQFVNMVNPFLRTVQGQRGITDFLVVCDATNNTPQVIDANQFVGDIYIKPNRSINFIKLNFVAVPTGVQFSTVVGQF
jgi:phage tail sheath protein FI